MHNEASYIKDSNDFKSKIKNVNIYNDALLVTADVVGLYPSLPYEANLRALREALLERILKTYLLKILLKWQSKQLF